MNSKHSLTSLPRGLMYLTTLAFGLMSLVLFVAPAWSAANFSWKISPMVAMTAESHSPHHPQDKVIPDRRSPQPGVDPVEDSPMTGQQIARVFNPALALDHALAQVAQGWENA